MFFLEPCFYANKLHFQQSTAAVLSENIVNVAIQELSDNKKSADNLQKFAGKIVNEVLFGAVCQHYHENFESIVTSTDTEKDREED